MSVQVVQSKWEEFERALMKLQSWLRDQEDKIKHCRLTGQEAGMKLSLKDINVRNVSDHNSPYSHCSLFNG